MRIKNWDKYNHYKHKSDMKWFKCYGRDLLNDADFMMMDDVKQVTLFKLWCLASESQGRLPQVSEIAFRLRKPIDFIEKMLKELDNWLITDESLDKLYTNPIADKIRLDKIIKTNVLFNKFWDAYPTSPRKVNKTGCLKKWHAKDLDLIADKIINHVKMMADTDWKKDDGQYIPMPATYLRQARYDIELPKKRKAWENAI